MYIRKSEGPRAVTLPDGSFITRADLPPPDTSRWVASRKAAVVRALQGGLISRDWAKSTYSLSDDEIAIWEEAVTLHGTEALKATQLKRYRK